MSSTRRQLLAATAGATALHSASARAASTPPGQVSVTLTSAAGARLTPHAPLSWTPARGAEGDLSVHPRERRQRLQGFGAALTDSACTVLARMPADGRAALLRDIYDPQGLGLSMARLCIGASDYATELFSYDEGEPDPELKRFSIDHDRRAVLPVLKQVLAVKPDLFLFASPWSPPGWMKYGGSMKGGSIRPQNLGVYARYITRYLEAYRAEGAMIRAVTIQNETDADQAGRMAACAWPQETEDDYIALHLGPALAPLGAKIWILDHNYDLWGRVLDQLDKPEVRRFVDAVAWHGYKGEARNMARVHAACPGVGAHWTEGGAMVDDPDFMTGWSRWSATIAGILNNWAQSVTVWNLALDEAGRPNIGPFTCGGLVTVRSDTQAVERTALYYALGHYARALRPGDQVVRTACRAEGMACAAAASPEGWVSLVATNSGAARRLSIVCEGRTVDWAAPADSVATLRWREHAA